MKLHLETIGGLSGTYNDRRIPAGFRPLQFRGYVEMNIISTCTSWLPKRIKPVEVNIIF